MTRDEMKEVFKNLSLAYGNKFDVSKEKIDYWYNLLKGNTFKQVEKNANNHIKSSVFPPTIADLNVQGSNYKPFDAKDYLRVE